MPPASPVPNVQVTLNGLQMVFVGPESKSCVVGVLRDAPAGHDFEIEIRQADENGNFRPFAYLSQNDINSRLTLEVSDASQTGVTRRKMEAPFDRRQGPTVENRDSFRWVLDFESEIYQQPIGANPEGFASLLTVNAGELLTRRISDNQLIMKPPHGDEEILGQVATETGIDIVLDTPQSKAIFKNGSETIFEADNKSSFLITFKRSCSMNETGTDADSFYTAVGDLIPDEEKIRFSATSLTPLFADWESSLGQPGVEAVPPNTPDARCLNGGMSISSP